MLPISNRNQKNPHGIIGWLYGSTLSHAMYLRFSLRHGLYRVNLSCNWLDSRRSALHLFFQVLKTKEVCCLHLVGKKEARRNLAFGRPFSDVKPLPELSVFNFKNVSINCLWFCFSINTQFSGTFCPEGNV